MHMTGMESFNVASKRGALPMNPNGTAMTSTTDSSQVVNDNRGFIANKSNMCKFKLDWRFELEAILNNKNKAQPGKPNIA